MSSLQVNDDFMCSLHTGYIPYTIKSEFSKSVVGKKICYKQIIRANFIIDIPHELFSMSILDNRSI